MPVNVSYIGGPRHGKKNTLRDKDQYPEQIPVTAKETRAARMNAGHYRCSETTADSAVYTWQGGAV